MKSNIDLQDGWYHWARLNWAHIFIKVRNKQIIGLSNVDRCPGAESGGIRYQKSYPSLSELDSLIFAEDYNSQFEPKVEDCKPHVPEWVGKKGCPEYINNNIIGGGYICSDTILYIPKPVLKKLIDTQHPLYLS